ncbi:MAG: DUF4286 family protein [Chitinophagaceae bacterium]|nr:DUF4286 family protein [Chitinophagaceae bacterium]
MYIYNVTIKITKEKSEAWQTWLNEEHLQDVLKTKCFFQANFFKLLEPKTDDDDDSDTFVVQYFCNTEKDYENYILNFSETLRKKGEEKFGGHFIGFRSFMKMLKTL